MDIPTTLDPGTEPGMVGRIQAWTTALGADTPSPVAEPASPGGTAAAADLVDELRALEELVCAAQARQAALAAALPESKATGSQVGLARRVSPVKGRIQLGLARILTAGELPYTWAAFRAGAISEWRVTIIARETACLTLEHRSVSTPRSPATRTACPRWATARWSPRVRSGPSGSTPPRSSHGAVRPRGSATWACVPRRIR